MTTDHNEIPAGLDPWDLVDPAQFLTDLAREQRLDPGLTMLARVKNPATRQQLLSHATVWDGEPPADPETAEDDVALAMMRIGYGENWGDPLRLESVVVTVVVRPGRSFVRSRDLAAILALRYANNEFQALRGDLILVTQHGWVVSPDGLAGEYPALAARLPLTLVGDS